MALAAAAVARRTRAATVAAMVGAVLLDQDGLMMEFLGGDPFPDAVARLHHRVQNESPDGLDRAFASGAMLVAADVVSGVWRHRWWSRRYAR
jgi:hypothetical protein